MGRHGRACDLSGQEAPAAGESSESRHSTDSDEGDSKRSRFPPAYIYIYIIIYIWQPLALSTCQLWSTCILLGQAMANEWSARASRMQLLGCH